MKHTSLFIFLIVIVASCNNEPKTSNEITKKENTSQPVENKIMIPVSSCYSSATGKDSVHLKVEIFENVVTGNLSYKFHEKDSNKGDFEGKLHGDTLLADYTFMSEGVQSTRQVIFFIKDDVAIEGYGVMEEKNGKMVFKDTGGVTFGKGLTLKKVDCGEH